MMPRGPIACYWSLSTPRHHREEGEVTRESVTIRKIRRRKKRERVKNKRSSVHTENTFSNLVNLNLNLIGFTIFRLIFIRLLAHSLIINKRNNMKEIISSYFLLILSVRNNFFSIGYLFIIKLQLKYNTNVFKYID